MIHEGHTNLTPAKDAYRGGEAELNMMNLITWDGETGYD